MGLIVFAAYALGMIFVIKGLKTNKTTENSFYINNRSSSAALVAFSIVASCVGASATIGSVGLAFTVGTPAFWWLGSGAAGLSILAVCLARRVRRSQAYTLPEMVEKYYGFAARRIISVIIVIAWVSILAAQFKASTQIIQALTGLQAPIALLLGVLLIVVHTLVSGQSGVIKLDRIQCILMVAGLLLAVFWLAGLNPGAIKKIQIEVLNEQFPLSRICYFLVVLGGGYVVCPMLFGRLLSANSERTAQKGSFWAVIGLCIISAIIVLVGLLTRGLIPAETAADQVLTTVLTTVLPTWLTYATYLALLSAIVSSADSCLITAGLILARDIWLKPGLKYTRLCVIALAIVGILVTFMQKSILGFLLMANDIYVCGVVAPVFIAIILGEKRKARIPLILAALILGGALGLLSSITGLVYFSYLGVAASGLLTLISFAHIRIYAE